MVKKSKIYDIDAERYSIAGFLKNTKILADLPRNFDENIYSSKLYGTCFSAIREALKDGEDINPYLVATKISNLGMNFSELSGGTLLEHLEEIKSGISLTEQATLDFARRLCRISLLRERESACIKVDDFLNDKKNWELSPEEIINFTDQAFQGNLSLYTREGKEFVKIFDIIEGIIEDRGNNPIDEFGYHGPFETFNKWFDAPFTPGDIHVTASRSNIGKAQDVNCKVLTPMGWVKIGDIKIGDNVIGSDGNAKHVIGVFPQGMKKSFKVTMDDGGFTYSCDEHLWLTKTYKNRKNKTNKEAKVKTLKEISESLIDIHGGANHGIQFVKPINFAPKELPLHPYLLGVLIGDGGFSVKKSTILTAAEEEVLTRVRLLLPQSDQLVKVGSESNRYDYRITKREHCASDNYYGENCSETQKILKELKLHGLKSPVKFIPEDYKYSSVTDRIELLRGLMDTDGSCNKQGVGAEFSSASKVLAEDVKELVLSLGGKASIKEKKITFYKKDGIKHFCLPAWRVRIIFQSESLINPFFLSRKALCFKFGTKKKYRYIKSVDQVADAESVCIQINSDDSLYVTDDYILTHNTSLGFFKAISVIEKYKCPFLWIDAGEMLPIQIMRRAICSLSRGFITTYMLKSGKWRLNKDLTKIVRDIWPRIKEIKDLFFFRNIGGLSSQEICSTINRFWLSEVGRFAELPTFDNPLGPSFPVNYDYLKPVDAAGGKNSQEYQEVGTHMENIKALITTQVPACIHTYLQTNRSGITRGKKMGDFDISEASFAMSDRVYHNCSNAYILREKTTDELVNENQQFGNRALHLVKKRDLGELAHKALEYIRQPDGSIMENYLHLNQEGFYWEEKGTLEDSVKAQDIASEDDNDDGDVELR